MKNNIFGEPVLTDAKWTSAQLMQMLGITQQDINNYRYRLGLEIEYKTTEKGKVALYNFEQYCKIKDYREKLLEHKKLLEQKKMQQKPQDIERQKTLEELRREHPLVTDDRCFNLNWWPEVTPINFECEE